MASCPFVMMAALPIGQQVLLLRPTVCIAVLLLTAHMSHAQCDHGDELSSAACCLLPKYCESRALAAALLHLGACTF